MPNNRATSLPGSYAQTMEPRQPTKYRRDRLRSRHPVGVVEVKGLAAAAWPPSLASVYSAASHELRFRGLIWHRRTHPRRAPPGAHGETDSNRLRKLSAAVSADAPSTRAILGLACGPPVCGSSRSGAFFVRRSCGCDRRIYMLDPVDGRGACREGQRWLALEVPHRPAQRRLCQRRGNNRPGPQSHVGSRGVRWMAW